jgi:hypothetical protein
MDTQINAAQIPFVRMNLVHVKQVPLVKRVKGAEQNSPY